MVVFGPSPFVITVIEEYEKPHFVRNDTNWNTAKKSLPKKKYCLFIDTYISLWYFCRYCRCGIVFECGN
jgi:hypothetical protein